MNKKFSADNFPVYNESMKRRKIKNFLSFLKAIWKGSKPLAKLFKTPSKFYIYDAGTNKVMSCEPSIYIMLEKLFSMDIKEAITDFLSKYAWDEFLYASGSIRSVIKSQNVLLTTKVEKFGAFDTFEEYESLIHSSLEILCLETCEMCNLRCAYCIYNEHASSKRNHGKQSMNWEVARRAIDYLKEHSLCSKNVAISFYGGEPLVNFPLIEECVTYARSILSDKPLTFSISTNGTLVTSKIAEFFHKNSFQVLLSIDGPREIHDGYRKDFNGNGSFDHALKGLRCLFDAYGDESTGKIHLNMVYSPPWSSQRLDRIAELWEEVSWLPKEMKLHISYPTPGSILPGMYSNSGDDEDKSLQEWSYEKFYDEFIGKGFSNAVASSVTEPRIAGLVKRSVCQEPMDQYSLNGCCIPGVRRLYVTVDGTFHVCERINHTAPTIGNVYSGIDIEVIRKIYLDEYTKAIFPFCSNCWAVELCKSCYMDIFSNGKLDFKNREHYCPAEKKSLEVLLSNYCSLLEQDSQKLKYLYDYEQL